MFIYVARHAWAYERDYERWPDDSLRELTPEGIERYQSFVRTLASRGFAPTRIATSPYVRCRQSAEIIANELGGHLEIDELDALEPDSNINAALRWTGAKTGSVCWIGHAPDVSYLTAALIGSQSANIRFAKGAVAAVRMDEPTGEGDLYWHVTAKVLGV